MDQTAQFIAGEEGYRRHPYRCTKGRLTIGYGFNLDDEGLARDEAEAVLHLKIKKIRGALRAALPWFDGIGEARQAALIGMAYQIGTAGLLGFRRTLDLIRRGEYEQASIEMLKSQWASQTPFRARRTAEMMRTGRFEGSDAKRDNL